MSMSTNTANAAIMSTITMMNTKTASAATMSTITMMNTKTANAATMSTITMMNTNTASAAIMNIITIMNMVIITQMMYLQAGAQKHLKHIPKNQLKIFFPHFQTQLIMVLFCVQRVWYRKQTATGFTSTLRRANMRKTRSC